MQQLTSSVQAPGYVPLSWPTDSTPHSSAWTFNSPTYPESPDINPDYVLAPSCPSCSNVLTGSYSFSGLPGTYTLRVRYFDYPAGVSRFRLLVAGQSVDEWTAHELFPQRVYEPDGASSTRRVVPGIELRPGDEIRVEGTPQAPETAALDYIEIVPDRE